jgi:Na+-transporting NADH:ubiquinone oxidoreductase subunit E
MVLRNYTFWQSVVFAFGSAVGWTLAIIIMAAINERLRLIADIPKGLRGPGIVVLTSGIIALSFIGFAGMVGV